MLQKIKNHLIILATVAGFSVSVLAPIGVASAANNIQDSLCQGTNIATTGVASNGCAAEADSNAFNNVAKRVVNIFSVIVGIIAVIFIIYGGFKYITSGGDSNNVSGAKNTLIYAIVGLIIVAMAQFIVRYVFNTAAGAVTPSA
ncbi:MAG: rane protein [Candidatus Saccharibacteria bacterium]|nr:rane protein [Candidatus Saccharibacteria bacterium]